MGSDGDMSASIVQTMGALTLVELPKCVTYVSCVVEGMARPAKLLLEVVLGCVVERAEDWYVKRSHWWRLVGV
jgi:hypothetical protein